MSRPLTPTERVAIFPFIAGGHEPHRPLFEWEAVHHGPPDPELHTLANPTQAPAPWVPRVNRRHVSRMEDCR